MSMRIGQDDTTHSPDHEFVIASRVRAFKSERFQPFQQFAPGNGFESCHLAGHGFRQAKLNTSKGRDRKTLGDAE